MSLRGFEGVCQVQVEVHMLSYRDSGIIHMHECTAFQHLQMIEQNYLQLPQEAWGKMREGDGCIFQCQTTKCSQNRGSIEYAFREGNTYFGNDWLQMMESITLNQTTTLEFLII